MISRPSLSRSVLIGLLAIGLVSTEVGARPWQEGVERYERPHGRRHEARGEHRFEDRRPYEDQRQVRRPTRSERPPEDTQRIRLISRDEAADRALRVVDGRVLRVRLQQGPRPVYQVKILTPNRRVMMIPVDAQTGALLR